MLRVLAYELKDVVGVQTVMLPPAMGPLRVGLRNGYIVELTAVADPETPVAAVRLAIVETGAEVQAHWRYLGTYEKQGGLQVFHVFLEGR